MSEKKAELKRFQERLDEARAEFDLATKCLIEALNSFNERLERLEKWIPTENQRPINP